MAASIFISFAGRDLKTASAIGDALEAAGFDCWMSSRDVPPGENFQIAIVRAIRAAQAMVLVFTHHANHSEEVAKELALASQTRLRVVPLRMEDVMPNEAFAYEFATRQWIDFTPDWDAAMAQLRRRLEVVLADTPPATAPPDPRPDAGSPAAVQVSAARRASRWPLLAAIVLAGLSAAAVAAYVTWSAPRPTPPVAAPAQPPKPAETNDVF
jgi:hypothetical protein